MFKKGKNIFLVFGILLIMNVVFQSFYFRFDLTHDKRYTITDVTANLLKQVDKKLFVSVYLEGDFPAEFNRLQIETRQFLEELQAKNSNLVIEFINPDNKREELIAKGMTPSQLTVEENGKLSNAIIFPWAELTYQNKTENVSLLTLGIMQSQEQQMQHAIENLEYSFTNAINNLVVESSKKIAVLTGNGELEDIYLYSLLNEVTKKHFLAKFTLDSVASNPQKTLNDLANFDLAIIAKPTQKFTEREKLVLDQFIMKGGKTLWMIDNVQADTDSLYTNDKILAYSRDLNITDLLFSYGVRINSVLIQDLYSAKLALATGNIGNQPQFQNLPWFFHPLVNGNPYHSITKNVAPVRLQFTNPIDTLENDINKIPLLVSSPLTKKIGVPSFIELQSIANEPNQEEYNSGHQLFAVLLQGNFTSNYNNRIKPFNLNAFTEKSELNKMIVIADGDVGKNQILKRKPVDLSYDKWTNEQFGNKEFLLNSIDYLLDDTGIISLRNKTLQINLLDKQKAFKEKHYWQSLNVLLPLILLFCFGLTINYRRRKKHRRSF